MVDLRRWGPSSRTSPEDPNCRVIDIVRDHWELGGAANVARWLALGQQEHEVHLICQYAFDDTGRMLQRLCKNDGVQLHDVWLRRHGNYKTTLKERICVIDPEAAKISQHVRCDQDTNLKLGAHEREALIKYLVEDDPFDFYVVADYGKGVFTSPYSPGLLGWIGHLSCRKPVVVNSKSPERWTDTATTALICNQKEFETLRTLRRRTDNLIHAEVDTDYLVVTMSSQGVRIITERDTFRMESKATEVLDVTGAGDAFTAGFAYAMFRQSGIPHMGVNTWLDRGSEWAAQCCRQIGCGKPNGDKEGPLHGKKLVSVSGVGAR